MNDSKTISVELGQDQLAPIFVQNPVTVLIRHPGDPIDLALRDLDFDDRVLHVYLRHASESLDVASDLSSHVRGGRNSIGFRAAERDEQPEGMRFCFINLPLLAQIGTVFDAGEKDLFFVDFSHEPSLELIMVVARAWGRIQEHKPQQRLVLLSSNEQADSLSTGFADAPIVQISECPELPEVESLDVSALSAISRVCSEAGVHPLVFLRSLGQLQGTQGKLELSDGQTVVPLHAGLTGSDLNAFRQPILAEELNRIVLATTYADRLRHPHTNAVLNLGFAQEGMLDGTRQPVRSLTPSSLLAYRSIHGREGVFELAEDGLERPAYPLSKLSRTPLGIVFLQALKEGVNIDGYDLSWIEVCDPGSIGLLQWHDAVDESTVTEIGEAVLQLDSFRPLIALLLLMAEEDGVVPLEVVELAAVMECPDFRLEKVGAWRTWAHVDGQCSALDSFWAYRAAAALDDITQESSGLDPTGLARVSQAVQRIRTVLNEAGYEVSNEHVEDDDALASSLWEYLGSLFVHFIFRGTADGQLDHHGHICQSVDPFLEIVEGEFYLGYFREDGIAWPMHIEVSDLVLLAQDIDDLFELRLVDESAPPEFDRDFGIYFEQYQIAFCGEDIGVHRIPVEPPEGTDQGPDDSDLALIAALSGEIDSGAEVSVDSRDSADDEPESPALQATWSVPGSDREFTVQRHERGYAYILVSVDELAELPDDGCLLDDGTKLQLRIQRAQFRVPQTASVTDIRAWLEGNPAEMMVPAEDGGESIGPVKIEYPTGFDPRDPKKLHPRTRLQPAQAKRVATPIKVPAGTVVSAKVDGFDHDWTSNINLLVRRLAERDAAIAAVEISEALFDDRGLPDGFEPCADARMAWKSTIEAVRDLNRRVHKILIPVPDDGSVFEHVKKTILDSQDPENPLASASQFGPPAEMLERLARLQRDYIENWTFSGGVLVSLDYQAGLPHLVVDSAQLLELPLVVRSGDRDVRITVDGLASSDRVDLLQNLVRNRALKDSVFHCLSVEGHVSTEDRLARLSQEWDSYFAAVQAYQAETGSDEIQLPNEAWQRALVERIVGDSNVEASQIRRFSELRPTDQLEALEQARTARETAEKDRQQSASELSIDDGLHILGEQLFAAEDRSQVEGLTTSIFVCESNRLKALLSERSVELAEGFTAELHESALYIGMVAVEEGHELVHALQALDAHLLNGTLPHIFKVRMSQAESTYNPNDDEVLPLAGRLLMNGNLLTEFVGELSPEGKRETIVSYIAGRVFGSGKGGSAKSKFRELEQLIKDLRDTRQGIVAESRRVPCAKDLVFPSQTEFQTYLLKQLGDSVGLRGLALVELLGPTEEQRRAHKEAHTLYPTHLRGGKGSPLFQDYEIHYPKAGNPYVYLGTDIVHVDAKRMMMGPEHARIPLEVGVITRPYTVIPHESITEVLDALHTLSDPFTFVENVDKFVPDPSVPDNGTEPVEQTRLIGPEKPGGEPRGLVHATSPSNRDPDGEVIFKTIWRVPLGDGKYRWGLTPEMAAGTAEVEYTGEIDPDFPHRRVWTFGKEWTPVGRDRHAPGAPGFRKIPTSRTKAASKRQKKPRKKKRNK